jgi:hypothetical protein
MPPTEVLLEPGRQNQPVRIGERSVIPSGRHCGLTGTRCWQRHGLDAAWPGLAILVGEVIDTTTGTSAGAVVVNSPLLWNNGQNFGVWLRMTA